MGTTSTQRQYTLSEFVAAVSVNELIFLQELMEDVAVVEKPTGISRAGDRVTVSWSSVTVSQATFDAVDADVAAHVGGNFSSLPLTAVSEGVDTDDSGAEVDKVTLDSQLLRAGTYLLGWYAEIKTNAEVALTAAVARLYVTKNGGAEQERGSKTWQFPAYNQFSGSFPFTAVDGDRYELRLAYERLGGSSNPVSIQRGRLAITQLS